MAPVMPDDLTKAIADLSNTDEVGALRKARKRATKIARRETFAWAEALDAVKTVRQIGGGGEAAVAVGFASYVAKGGRLDFRAWQRSVLNAGRSVRG